MVQDDDEHFNLPDMRGRVALGYGSGIGLTVRNMGDDGGEETHTLTTAEMPTHNHGYWSYSYYN